MATKGILDQLEATDARLSKVNQDKLLRNSLGDESLAKDFDPRLKRIKEIWGLVKQYAPLVHDTYVSSANAVFNQIASSMVEQADLNSSNYISSKTNFLSNVDSRLDEAQKWLPFFITAAIYERGFLSDEGIRQEYARTVESLKSETAATLATVKQEAEKAVMGAKELAAEIETRARRTASKISMKDAQDQFKDATEKLSGKVKLWGGLVIASLVLLAGAAALFMLWPLPKGSEWPEALYHTLLRVLILSSLAGGATLCIRLFRAHMHMAALNEHRVRVANSVEGFVNSALEPQQRDLILAKLVEAIVDFGESGIIRGEKDDAGSPALSGEFVARILSAISSKKS